MKRVTGIGGIFFKAKDPVALGAWYRQHLGIDVQSWGGAAFRWQGDDNRAASAPRSGAVPGRHRLLRAQHAPFMINYRVDDLQALLAALRAEGVQVDDKVETSEHGSFGWVIDPEGNKLELWQPPAGQ